MDKFLSSRSLICIFALLNTVFLLGCSFTTPVDESTEWGFSYQIEDPAWKPHLPEIKKSWEQANKVLRAFLPTPPCNNPRLFLVSQEQFDSISEAKLKPNGIYAKESIFLNYSTIFAKNQIRSTLIHEMTHAYLDCLSAGNSPVWFDEGLAQILERDFSLAEKEKDRAFLKSKKLLTEQEINNSFSILNREKAVIAYKQSKLIVSYLLKITNRSRLKIYLEHLKNEDPNAFQRAFAIDLKSFYVNSERYIRHN